MPPQSPSTRTLLAVGAALAFTLLSTGLALGQGLTFGQSPVQPDAGPVPNASPERRGEACGPITLTHSLSQAVFPGNSWACFNPATGHADSRYLRAFDLAAFGVPEGFAVCEVQIGIENAQANTQTGGGGTQPLLVNLYTSNPPFPGGTLTPIGGAAFEVPDQALTVVPLPLGGVAPAGSELVVEIFTPDGQAAGNFFFIGSNPDGETGPSYVQAAPCAVPFPVPTAEIDFPDMHIVINVVGDRVIDIPPGEDCWQTDCGRTKMSFCDLDGTALPAGFFAPGSEPFAGEILFGGAGQETDTSVQRLQPMILPEPGSEAQTPIELVELDLVSCDPITVIVDGADTEWDVEVTLSEVDAGTGMIGVTRTHGNGGTFQAEFPLHPVFTFTRVDDPSQVVVLDTGLEGLPPFQFATVGQAPWVSELTGPDPPTTCGPNFAPGVEEDPETLEQCCRKVGHAGPGHLHETGPPVCMPCPRGACCDPAAGSCSVLTATACADAGGEYKGDGTNCNDSDGDGVADVLETNSCCAVRDACNTGTDPGNPDTDGDGWDDGAELALGFDPCGGDVLLVDGFESGDVSAWSSSVGG